MANKNTHGAQVIPRAEYPRPQLRRDEWQTLNGTWEFDFDDGDEGIAKSLWNGETPLKKSIIVPFSYQYPASGIGDTSVHPILWYRRTFTPAYTGKRALLSFGQAEYRADVWVNGVHAVSHEGGFAPFSADITDLLRAEENVLVVRCEAGTEVTRARGKQSWTGAPFGCWYTPNSGIRQSVWIDYVGEDYLAEHALTPDVDRHVIEAELTTGRGIADEAEITLTFEGQEISRERCALHGNIQNFTVTFPHGFLDRYLWSPEFPRLVYVEIRLFSAGVCVDLTHSRIAIRKVRVDAHGKITLNDRPLYQRLVLDQGYWPESGLTPPTAEALKKDIELAQAMGFNGARKHQKFEDPYFYYYAEELGFLTWCEMPSAYLFGGAEMRALTREWQEILAVARNFGSIVAYVPINESWGIREVHTVPAQKHFARALYALTKATDPGKLVSTNDGFENLSDSDILTIHDYDIVRAEEFPKKYRPGEYDALYPQAWPLFAEGETYRGQPVIFSEFGGISVLSEQSEGAWGYHDGAKDAETLCGRLSELLRGISQTEFQGYCYTQLTDVQQEQNGLLRADRTPKADVDILKSIFTI